jgi:hypothetical protein
MHLSEAAVQSGFWSPTNPDLPAPKSIRDPDEFRGEDVLAIACTQLGDTALQRRLVRAWVSLLPTLKDVRFLWLRSRVPQGLFDAACRMPGLEGLYIKWSGIKDLTPLRGARGLRYLRLGSSTQITDERPLWDLQQLVVLEVENIPVVRELDGIVALEGLEQLAVEGSIWTTQHVKSLAPLGTLGRLRHLGLTNLRAREPSSLRVLGQLRQLVHLRLAQWWSPGDMADLASALPHWKYGTTPPGRGAT